MTRGALPRGDGVEEHTERAGDCQDNNQTTLRPLPVFRCKHDEERLPTSVSALFDHVGIWSGSHWTKRHMQPISSEPESSKHLIGYYKCPAINRPTYPWEYPEFRYTVLSLSLSQFSRRLK